MYTVIIAGNGYLHTYTIRLCANAQRDSRFLDHRKIASLYGIAKYHNNNNIYRLRLLQYQLFYDTRNILLYILWMLYSRYYNCSLLLSFAIFMRFTLQLRVVLYNCNGL